MRRPVTATWRPCSRMLRAGVGAGTERCDVDEHGWPVALVIDCQPELADAAAVRKLTTCGVGGELADENDLVEVRGSVGHWFAPFGRGGHDACASMSLKPSCRPPYELRH